MPSQLRGSSAFLPTDQSTDFVDEKDLTILCIRLIEEFSCRIL